MVDSTLYRQLVGSLIYLTATLSNIAYAVHIVSQFMAAPHTTHFTAVLRILRYIKGTNFHGLYFSTQSSLVLRAYSKKKTVVSRSSAEVEYRALADSTFKLLWLRWLL